MRSHSLLKYRVISVSTWRCLAYSSHLSWKQWPKLAAYILCSSIVNPSKPFSFEPVSSMVMQHNLVVSIPVTPHIRVRASMETQLNFTSPAFIKSPLRFCKTIQESCRTQWFEESGAFRRNHKALDCRQTLPRAWQAIQYFLRYWTHWSVWRNCSKVSKRKP